MVDITQYVDITLVILLLGLGKLIKSSSLFKKIPNDTIPLLISIIGIGLELIFCGISMDSIMRGVCSGLVSTGTHQLGKNLFKTSNNTESNNDLDIELMAGHELEEDEENNEDNSNEEEYYG